MLGELPKANGGHTHKLFLAVVRHYQFNKGSVDCALALYLRHVIPIIAIAWTKLTSNKSLEMNGSVSDDHLGSCIAGSDSWTSDTELEDHEEWDKKLSVPAEPTSLSTMYLLQNLVRIAAITSLFSSMMVVKMATSLMSPFFPQVVY
jgi:hypothetical protein